MAEDKVKSTDYYYNKAPTFVEESTLLYYLNIIRRRIWLVIPVLLVAGTIGMVRAVRAPYVYRATAKILVERFMPRAIRMDLPMQDTGGYDPDFNSTQAELVKSRIVMEYALENPAISRLFQEPETRESKRSFLGELRQTIVTLIGALPAPPPESWEILRSQIQVKAPAGTHFLTINAEGGNAQSVAVLVNSVAESFIRFHMERKKEALGDAFLFLDKEKEKEAASLLKAEKELEEFRNSAREMALNSAGSVKEPVLVLMDEISGQLTQAELRKIDLTSQIKVIHEVVKQESLSREARDRQLLSLPSIQSDEAISAQVNNLSNAEKSLAQLANTYGPEHPKIKDARLQVVSVLEQFRKMLDQKVLSLESELKTVNSKEDELRATMESQKGKAMNLSQEVFTFNRLQNEVNRHRKLHDALLERLREVDLSAGFVRTNAEVVDRAAVPNAPMDRGTMRKILFALFLGLALGITIAFVTENLDDTIKTPEDLKKKLEIPLLGFVPHAETAAKDDDKEAEGDFTRKLISLREPTSSVAEAYRDLRTKLLFSIPDGQCRIIGFTSSTPSEGKTTTSCNMAFVMGRAAKKVLLVDSDLQRPMVHRMLGIDNTVGLTSILTGQAAENAPGSIYHYAFDDGLGGSVDVIPAGPDTPTPSELLGSDRMVRLLKEAKKSYDWVFVDIPPILFISDASIVSSICEGIVFVVKAGKNNRSMINKAKDQLDSLKVRLIGSVLNDVQLSRLGRYYSDYAYYGYSKYSTDYYKTYHHGGKKSGHKKAEGKKQ